MWCHVVLRRVVLCYAVLYCAVCCDACSHQHLTVVCGRDGVHLSLYVRADLQESYHPNKAVRGPSQAKGTMLLTSTNFIEY